MNTRILLILLSSLRYTISCISQNNRSTYLWAVEDPLRETRAYLFGTIHVPYTAVWDRVSHRVKDAFEQSDTVAFEVDLHDELTSRRLVKCKNLKRKEKIQSYLPPSIYKRLRKLMETLHNRIYLGLIARAQSNEELKQAEEHAMRLHHSIIDGWERKRPEWLLFLLYQLCDNVHDRMSDAPILDLFLAEKAHSEEKELHSIESVEEQCNPISTVTHEQVLFAINYTLSYLERGEEHPATKRKQRTLTELVRDYRCGTVEEALRREQPRREVSVIDSADDAEEQIEDQLREDILVTRNERMARRIRSLLESKPHSKLFVALGTGHFFGERSILDHLTEMNLLVWSIREDDVISYNTKREQRVQSLWIRGKNDVRVTIEITQLPNSQRTFHPRIPLFLLLLNLAALS